MNRLETEAEKRRSPEIHRRRQGPWKDFMLVVILRPAFWRLSVVRSPWKTSPSVSPDAGLLIYALVGTTSPYRREPAFLSPL